MEENDSILRFSNKKTNKDDFVSRNLLRAYRIVDLPEEIIVFPHTVINSSFSALLSLLLSALSGLVIFLFHML